MHINDTSNDTSAVVTLAQWLSGEFSNQNQALKEPAWFVNLRLWHRPIPHRLDGHLAIFAEQANAIYPNQSYRQRIVTLQTQADSMQPLQAQYFGFKHPEQFKGAGINPELLKTLTLDDLEFLPGCVLEVTQTEQRFMGRARTGDRCQFHYQDKTGQNKMGQVVLGFDVQADQFWSYDKGVDPETEKPIWGALMGPYCFTKTQDFAADLPL